MGKLWCTIKKATSDFGSDNIMVYAAAMTFYALLSLSPLLILLVTLAAVIGPDLQEQLVQTLEASAGAEIAGIFESLLENARQDRPAAGASAMIGLAVLLVGATTAFSQLQISLNRVFKVHAAKGFLFNWLYKRILSLLMVIGIGIVIVASAVLSSIASWAAADNGVIWQVLSLILNLLVFAAIFVAMFKILPDIEIAWSHIFIGGCITALLFVIGSYSVGLYLGRSAPSSVYGAAGSVVVLLLWIFYSACIVLFGAELTQAYMHCYDKPYRPGKFAQWNVTGQTLTSDQGQEPV